MLASIKLYLQSLYLSESGHMAVDFFLKIGLFNVMDVLLICLTYVRAPPF